MGKLNGKVAIVTGAYIVEGGDSIGGVTALLMSREGAKVVVADVVDEPAERLVAKIKSEVLNFKSSFLNYLTNIGR